jgi:16S rRNA (guanine1516-N2)-methyltransferase
LKFSNLAVLHNDVFATQSEALAQRLRLPLLQAGTDELSLPPYILTYTDNGLALQQTGKKADGPVVIDFVSGTSAYRRSRGGGELIVKAAAGDKKKRPTVLDVTAGLGRDSFVLATWGYQVTALERSPIIASLLEDGLQRARVAVDNNISSEFGLNANHDLDAEERNELQAVFDRLQLIQTDALDYLSGPVHESPPDVIVIDPMFPPSKKTALVKKDMRAFHHVVGADSDSAQLLDAALAVAVHRVIVKRPKKAAFLAEKKPNFSVEGKAIRFDIYTIKSFAKA